MRICLIGVTHPCHNPRLVREADTLVEAGYDVRVVAPSFMGELRQKDRRLMTRRKWRLETVDARPIGLQGKCRSLVIRGRRRLARRVFQSLKSVKVAAHGYVMAFRELTALSSSEPADWFIAHTQAALPVAAAAARRWNARLGFDCEDLLAENGSDPPDIVRLIEKTYLPRCNYISAPSQCIADHLLEEYNIPAPIVLYNVFPSILAGGVVQPKQRQASSTLRLHWFGQIIGRGRGIEEAIEAIGMLGDGVEVHLRGKPAQGYHLTIEALCRKHRVTSKVMLHPPVDHDDLIMTMDEFDVGLALERPENPNYSRTVTNKMFVYLLAGLAVAATDTPGQKEVLNEVPLAGFLYPAGNPGALAKGLRRWLNDRGALRAAQQAAWEAGRRRFCWDVEKERFLRIFHPSSSSCFTRSASLKRG